MKMYTFKSFLIEMASSVLYHFTSIQNAFSIIKDNEFSLAADMGTGAEQNLRRKGKFYYLSTTRHKLGGFNLEPYNQGVMIKLRGDELNRRFTSKAVDYWGHEFRKIRPEKAEAEDRVYHTESTISNAKKYIEEIHILYSPDDYMHENSIRTMRRLLILLKNKEIPHWVYDDTKAFLLQDKRKSIKHPIETYKTGKKEQTKSYRPRRYYGEQLLAWTELVYKKDEKQLSKKAKELVSSIKYDYERESEKRKLEVEIHNSRTTDKESVAKFVKAMQLLRVSSVPEFVDAANAKWNNNK